MPDEGFPPNEASTKMENPTESQVGSSAESLENGSASCSNTIESGLQVLGSSRNDLVQFSRYCPGRPYIDIQIPSGIDKIHRIVFTITSHDQGFCGEPECVETYRNSSTWFEAGVATLPGRDNIPRRYILCNMTASFAFRTHTVTWDISTADDSLQHWMGSIQSGDTIQLLPRAQWKAWVNFIESARMEVHCKMIVPNPSVDSAQLTTTVTFDTSETWREIQSNYRHYEKLDNDGKTIRLLVLHPGAAEDPIHCDLVTSSLQDQERTSFEALSYCWGDPKDTQTISLSHLNSRNDSKAQQSFQITSGLNSALRNLRHAASQKRVLWADAICINQSDPQERGYQVDMMGPIYEHASSVRVWLGNSDDFSTTAMGLVRSVSGREFNWGAQYPGQDFGSAYPAMLRDISRLFAYPWFSRVWVVQEAWKARKAVVSCGSEEVPWEKVVESNTWMLEGHAGGFSGVQIHTLPAIWTKLAGNVADQPRTGTTQLLEQKPRFNMLDLVLEGMSLKATDARDKIFALLGMSKETIATSAKPSALRSDYTKSASSVFAEFTRWWITEYKSLRILSAIHASNSRAWQKLAESESLYNSIPPDHPSWALWHEGNGNWAKHTLGMSGLYKATGNTTAILHSSNPTCLRLGGLQLSTVISTHLYPFFALQEQDPGMMEAYTHLFDPDGKKGTWNFGPTSDKLQGERDKGKIPLLISDHYTSHWNRIPHPGMKDQVIDWFAGEEEIERWKELAFPCHGSVFFRNSVGNFGLCPPRTRVGDVVVVLFGGSVPFVLRKWKNSADGSGDKERDLFKLIGECYVQGWMHGAAIEKWERGERPVESFILV